MRAVNLLVAGLLAAGTLVCHGAWALPGEGLAGVHTKPLHSHATPDHEHDRGESAADPCEFSTAVQAPAGTVTAPPVAVAEVLPALDAFAPIRSPAPLPPDTAPVLPPSPVHRHVVLLI